MSKINRPTLVNDSGTNTDGTLFDADFWSDVFDRIDASTGTYANASGGANSGTSETVLMTKTIPANALKNNGDHLVWDFRGFTANNSNTKTIKMYLDGTAIGGTVTGTLQNIACWAMTGHIMRKTSTAYAAQELNHVSGSSPIGKVLATTFDWSVSHTLELRATGGATNDVVLETGFVRLVTNGGL
jgi:hypothetical protein